jgi:AcrR family transcriptional regulator
MDKVHGKEQTIDALIEAAIDLTSKKGPSGFSVREVAALAAVNHGLVHRHFGGKNQLIRQALNHVAQKLAAPLNDDQPQDQLASSLFNALSQEPRYLQCLAWAMLSEDSSDLVQDVFPTHDAVMNSLTNLSGGEDKSKLMLAFMTSVTVGWHMFKPLILQASQVKNSDTPVVEAQISHLLDTLSQNTNLFDGTLDKHTKKAR